jgi:alpha-D-ribose 1-methylphosphonate 5-triphosphate synthase subunit PhnL
VSDHPVLSVRNYSKSFILHEQGKTIPSSEDVNLDVYSGRLSALIGPTGVGKSTVLKGIYRTYVPGSGMILYRTAKGEQIDLAQADEHTILELRRTEIAFVTQFLHALPRQASEDIVAQPLLQMGAEKEEAQTKAREMLAAMNIPERLWGISPATFSGGEKQRVNLARGLIRKPRLLLLDEPTASLDHKTTETIIELIDELKNDGTAMLAIFHQQNLVKRLADSVVELTLPNTTESLLEDIA